MNSPPSYAHLTFQELQDALARTDRDREGTTYMALQNEIELRLNEPPLLREPSPAEANQSALYGCGGGLILGLVVGQAWFLILVERIKASGLNPYNHDDWGFGWIGCMIISVPICSIVGLVIGLSRSSRR